MKIKRILSTAMALFIATPMAVSFSAKAIEAVYGDANGDSAVNLSDMVTLSQFLHGRKSNIDLDLADINRDSSVDSLDLVQLRKHLLSLIKNALKSSPVSANSKNLTAGLNENASDKGTKEIDDEFRLAHSQFALDLLKREAKADENVMISPYSIMQALGMLANGADGETLSQMEKAMGGTSLDQLNMYLKQWRINQPNEEYCKLNTANSIWARNDENRIKPIPEFLQTTAESYNAEYYLAPFDNSTLDDVNSWINQKTDEMIPKVLDDIDPNDIMYLINAVAFDAKWEDEYEKDMVRTYDFTNFNGEVQKAEMLCSNESFIIHDEHATGIYKYYEGRKYAFAALLPEENMTVNEYIDSLTPEHFSTLFKTPEAEKGNTAFVKMPKFKYSYETKLKDTLAEIGMKDMFIPGVADLTKMTSVGKPYVGQVIHDTFIQLDEEGTKAAAVTVVVTKDNAVMMPKEEINFDRPFVYAIVDTETDMPVFIGTLMSIPE